MTELTYAPTDAPEDEPAGSLQQSDESAARPRVAASARGADQAVSLLHEFFEAAARRWPDRLAIDVPPSSRRAARCRLSYAALKQRSDALAHILRGRVMEAERIVVIILPRASEHLYIAQLAVLKAGAAFTCIDPAFPDGQARSILDDAEAAVVLTDAAGINRARRWRPDVPALDVSGLPEVTQQVPAAVAPPPWLSATSLAYLIYTSGTTGRPKGVMIEHRSIVNLVGGDLQTLGVTPDDRVAQSSSPAYDSSIEETWFALAAGATLVPMDEEATRLGPDLVEWLRRERITMFCPAPTLLRSTGCEDPERELPELRLLHPGGEALTSDVADRWARGRRLINDYGPTEATVTAMRCRVQPGQPISIGRPVPGMQAWVLDANLEEVPIGAEGELCLGGIGLARGYRHRPELTAGKFPLHPRLGRIYRTGDLARRDAAGNFFCHGRIDAQVKIRGYRIELEAIEARLVECTGVREAACAVQGEGSAKRLVAFVVPEPGAAPEFEALRIHLRETLPEYMVPALLAILPALPRNNSGKVNRQALPVLEAAAQARSDSLLAPRDALEEKLSLAFRQVLGLHEPISIHDDFVYGLGGDSLLAARLISLLRDDVQTAALTVRDLYEARTVAELAGRARSRPRQRERARGPGGDASGGAQPRPAGRPVAATAAQSLVLLAAIIGTAPLTYALTFQVLPALVARLGTVLSIALAPALYAIGLIAYAALAVVLAVAMKRILIGRYRPARAPVWRSLHVRNWIVQRCVRLVPWRLLEMTEFQNVVLRALGARIGRRVHIHRGVNLSLGGWDLLELGDDVTVGQNATLQLATPESGHIVFGPVTLDAGATLEPCSGVGAGARIGKDAVLTAWSHLAAGESLPAGARWDGVPARPAGLADPQPLDATPARIAPLLHGLMMILGRLLVEAFVALPLLAGALLLTWLSTAGGGGALDWLLRPDAHPRIAWLDLVLVLGSVPGALAFELIAMRLLGKVRPGVISRWSLAYIRMRLKVEITESAGRWLCGTLLWPVWLRAAGMRVGRGCEISTIIDTVPELVEIGSETFFADGIHLGGARIRRGAVTLAPVRLGERVFLGNHAVVRGGQHIPGNVLIGVCTVADDGRMRDGSAWFGHPPFELHQREVVACERSLTLEPSWPRYLNRVFWELLRFTVPLVWVAIGFLWYQLLIWGTGATSRPVFFLAVLPALEIGVLLLLALLVLATKWILLGRVRPGTHPLWSCWCSRWDFLYVVWDFCASGALAAVEGTLLLNAYLRAMGMKIGRRVVLAPSYVHVVDPDMLEFEDDATVNALLQAHTFEDRVLKIDRVIVRKGATMGVESLLLYGADVGERTHVMSNSVVMKRERLLADHAYAGCPTHPSPR